MLWGGGLTRKRDKSPKNGFQIRIQHIKKSQKNEISFWKSCFQLICIFTYFPVLISYIITVKNALQPNFTPPSRRLEWSKVRRASTLPYSRVSWTSKSAKNASYLFTLFKHFLLIRNCTHQLSPSCVKHRLQAWEYSSKNKSKTNEINLIFRNLLLNFSNFSMAAPIVSCRVSEAWISFVNNIKEIEPNKEIMVPINEGTSTYAYFFLHLLFKMREITQQSCI